MSVVAGSYDGFIWGYRLKSRKHSSTLSPIALTPLFSFPSFHTSIKSVALCGSVAFAGGSDDHIKIYDLSSATEMGSILHYSSSITSLSVYSPPQSSFPRNLIAGDDGGHVSIYDAEQFVHLKTVIVHKKSINSLAVHPSGKLALTVGRDDCFAMVNLVRGRRSFCCKLSKEASLVEFDNTGGKFYMVVEEKVSVHESEDARLVCEIVGEKRVLCAAPGNSGILFTGGEDRIITAWDTTSGKIAYTVEDAHAARLKGIVVMSKNNSDLESGENDPYIVSSASSDGVIRVWDVRNVGEGKTKPLSEANTKSRLTCLAGSSIKSLKRPREENISDKNPDAAV